MAFTQPAAEAAIGAACRALHLPTVRTEAGPLADQAAKERLTHRAYLLAPERSVASRLLEWAERPTGTRVCPSPGPFAYLDPPLRPFRATRVRREKRRDGGQAAPRDLGGGPVGGPLPAGRDGQGRGPVAGGRCLASMSRLILIEFCVRIQDS